MDFLRLYLSNSTTNYLINSLLRVPQNMHTSKIYRYDIMSNLFISTIICQTIIVFHSSECFDYFEHVQAGHWNALCEPESGSELFLPMDHEYIVAFLKKKPQETKEFTSPNKYVRITQKHGEPKACAWLYTVITKIWEHDLCHYSPLIFLGDKWRLMIAMECHRCFFLSLRSFPCYTVRGVPCYCNLTRNLRTPNNAPATRESEQ